MYARLFDKNFNETASKDEVVAGVFNINTTTVVESTNDMTMWHPVAGHENVSIFFDKRDTPMLNILARQDDVETGRNDNVQDTFVSIIIEGEDLENLKRWISNM